tara:strand:- start:274 stop:471 length:198 start_codon:yes stop_codon:yes gene_type:complete
MEYKETELNQNSSPDEGVSNSRSRVDLNNLIRKVKEEEKKSKRQNIVISAAALSVVAVFGLILTL